MNWIQVSNSLMSLVLPLALLAANWMVQGLIMTRPKEVKEIGRAILRGSFYFWGATVFIVILVEVFFQLSIWCK